MHGSMTCHKPCAAMQFDKKQNFIRKAKLIVRKRKEKETNEEKKNELRKTRKEQVVRIQKIHERIDQLKQKL